MSFQRSVVMQVATVFLLATFGCSDEPDRVATSDQDSSSVDSSSAVPEPDFSEMEEQVEESLRTARRAILTAPMDASTWGHFGMVAHAHELWNEASTAYLKAESLDPTEVRWPYYLGDVASVVGADLEVAVAAFRRAIALLESPYAPVHMRLGRVLVAAGNSDSARVELRKALQLQPGLQPARVTLAQIHLADSELEQAQELLLEVLTAEPRHEQALAALGQVKMRQGYRDEAREIALRARSAALYNLFEDPLMGEVVALGVSSILVWDRAKAFFDNENYQQAALGLQQVVSLRPDNADAHQQLGVALGNLGQLQQSRQSLERAVSLAPDRIEALVQLALVQLETGGARQAIRVAERILKLDASDPDAGWLLARAKVASGDVGGGLEVFDQLAGTGGQVPLWVRNDWGSALAQSGRAGEAVVQFRAVIAAQPENPQAHFYLGLVFEGQGRLEDAVTEYCRSMRAQPNPPAGSRLEALGARCG